MTDKPIDHVFMPIAHVTEHPDGTFTFDGLSWDSSYEESYVDADIAPVDTDASKACQFLDQYLDQHGELPTPHRTTLVAAIENAIDYQLGEGHWQDDDGNDRFSCGFCTALEGSQLCEDHVGDLERVAEYRALLETINNKDKEVPA